MLSTIGWNVNIIILHNKQLKLCRIDDANEHKDEGNSKTTTYHGIGPSPSPNIKISKNRQIIGTYDEWMNTSFAHAIIRKAACPKEEAIQQTLLPNLATIGDAKTVDISLAMPTITDAVVDGIVMCDASNIGFMFDNKALIPENCWNMTQRVAMMICLMYFDWNKRS